MSAQRACHITSRLLLDTIAHIVIHHSSRPRKWPVAHLPHCTSPISHNASFRTEMCTFQFWIMHCGIWHRCIVVIENGGNSNRSCVPTMHCDTRQSQPLFRMTNHKRSMPAYWRPSYTPLTVLRSPGWDCPSLALLVTLHRYRSPGRSSYRIAVKLGGDASWGRISDEFVHGRRGSLISSTQVSDSHLSPPGALQSRRASLQWT